MKILAFDTSSDTLTAGIYEDKRTLAEESPTGFARHSEVLLTVIEKLFKRARLKPGGIDLIAVGLGPGSFTGLRVGITTAKMLAFALKKRIIGIPSLEILAASQEIQGSFAIIADAKRNNVYAWNNRSKKTELTEIKKFLAKVPRGTAVLASFLLESSSKELLERKDCRTAAQLKPASAFHAAKLAAVLARKRKFTAPEDLKPLYLYPKDCNVTQKKK